MVQLDAQPQIAQTEAFKERAIPFLCRNNELASRNRNDHYALDTVQRVPMMPLYGTRAADQLSPEAIIAPYGWQ